MRSITTIALPHRHAAFGSNELAPAANTMPAPAAARLPHCSVSTQPVESRAEITAVQPVSSVQTTLCH